MKKRILNQTGASNTLRPGKYGHRFVHNISKCISPMRLIYFVPGFTQISNMMPLSTTHLWFKILAWHRIGVMPLRGLMLHRMLPKDVFEASFSFLSHYTELVFKKIANTFNWKTTHYSWLKQLLNPLSSPFYLYEGNFLPPRLTAIALFQHINTCNFYRSLQISLKFSVNITDPSRSWIMCKNI